MNEEELIKFASNQVEGPTLMHPPRPDPYYTCKGCMYFEKSMACSGGHRRPPTYYKSCIHPDVHTEYKLGRSLNNGIGRGETSGKEITPEWCPLMGDNNDE